MRPHMMRKERRPLCASGLSGANKSPEAFRDGNAILIGRAPAEPQQCASFTALNKLLAACGQHLRMEAPSYFRAGMVIAERSGALIKPRQPCGAGMPMVSVRSAVRRVDFDAKKVLWKVCFQCNISGDLRIFGTSFI